VKNVAFLVLCGPICFAQEPRKPVCNASVQGQFWPQEANLSQDAAQRLYQLGELERCSLAAKKYRWERLSVNVRDLAKSKRPAASESKKSGARENK
jgi:hypothetical protein